MLGTPNTKLLEKSLKCLYDLNFKTRTMKNTHCSKKLLHKKDVQLTLPMAAKNPISLKFLKFNSFPLSYIPPFSRSNFNKAMGCCVP